MKKIILQTLLVLMAMSAHAQIMMTLGDHRYDVATVDSITFATIELPSAYTSLTETGEYTIFAETLRRTGLADSMLVSERNKQYTMDRPCDRDYNPLYYPHRCNIGWTVFAERDAVFHAAGINNFNDLVAKCREWYGNPTWFDLASEKGIQISTGDDYANEWNVVHMFMAYHLVPAMMALDELVYEFRYSNQYWNYSFGYEPQAYYATMLPGTLLKVWQTNPKTTKELWLNRYVENNTLTDQYATFGSDAIHPLVYRGAKIDRWASIEAPNACIHSIDQMLLYNQQAYNAQHERMRFHVNQMLPELASNHIMRATTSEISIRNGGGNGNLVAFPTDFFDNLHCYDPNTILRYNVTAPWRALESTLFQGWGNSCDLAIRLPRVPSGHYEMRYLYTPSIRGGQIEFFVGNDSTLSSMQKMSTLDATLDPTTAEIGYENPNNGDFGIEAGKLMRQNGYMYAPASFSRGGFNTITDKLIISGDDPYQACRVMQGNTSCRTESGYGVMMLRYIIGTVDIKQSEDCWLRLKITPTDAYPYEISWMLNFVELVPTDVANHSTLMEDWY